MSEHPNDTAQTLAVEAQNQAIRALRLAHTEDGTAIVTALQGLTLATLAQAAETRTATLVALYRVSLDNDIAKRIRERLALSDDVTW